MIAQPIPVVSAPDAYDIQPLLRDPECLRQYCYQRSRHNLEEVVATLEIVWAHGNLNVAHRATQCGLLILYKEELERQRRGGPVRNAENLADAGFHFVTDEILAWKALAKQWLDIKPSSYGALTFLALSTLASESAQSAEPYFAAMRGANKGDLYALTHFDSAFHDGLELSARSGERDLPPVTLVRDVLAKSQRVIYVACDYAYFQAYGWALVASFFRCINDNISLHLHLFDILDSELAALEDSFETVALRRISISRERSGLSAADATSDVTQKAKNYYHLARFHRFWTFLNERPDTAAWLLDADLIFNNSPVALFDLLGDKDVSFMFLPGRLEPNNKIAAGYVGVAPKVFGRKYIQRVAGYVVECLRAEKFPWGTDQLALYCVYADMTARGEAPAVAAMPAHIADGKYGETATLWPAKCDPDDANYTTLRERLQLLKST